MLHHDMHPPLHALGGPPPFPPQPPFGMPPYMLDEIDHIRDMALRQGGPAMMRRPPTEEDNRPHLTADIARMASRISNQALSHAEAEAAEVALREMADALHARLEKTGVPEIAAPSPLRFVEGTELLEHICAFLSPADSMVAAFCCRRLRDAVFHHFPLPVDRAQKRFGLGAVHEKFHVGSVGRFEWALANGMRGPMRETGEVTQAAAEAGQLEVLQRARALGFAWGVGTCAAAARGGHINVLEWLRSTGSAGKGESKAAAKASGGSSKEGTADKGSIVINKGSAANGKGRMSKGKAKSDELVAEVKAKAHAKRKGRKRGGGAEGAEGAEGGSGGGGGSGSGGGGSGGPSSSMEHGESAELPKDEVNDDVKDEITHEVKERCPWDETVCEDAAEFGHLELLRWARTRKCKWDDRTTLACAYGGHLDILKWARGRGCPWHRNTLVDGALRGMIQHSKANARPPAHSPYVDDLDEPPAYDLYHCGDHFELFCWALDNGAPLHVRTALEAAAEAGAVDVLDHLMLNGLIPNLSMGELVPFVETAVLFGKVGVLEWCARTDISPSSSERILPPLDSTGAFPTGPRGRALRNPRKQLWHQILTAALMPNPTSIYPHLASSLPRAAKAATAKEGGVAVLEWVYEQGYTFDSTYVRRALVSRTPSPPSPRHLALLWSSMTFAVSAISPFSGPP